MVNSPLRKVGLLIIMVIILPVIVFSAFEIGNSRRNDKVIQEIYWNQLDAILYSINQYSDDVMGNLASRMENAMNSESSGTAEKVEQLLTEMQAAVCLMVFDNNRSFVYAVPDSAPYLRLSRAVTVALEDQRDETVKLRTYLRGGYRKIMALPLANDSLQAMAFLTRVHDSVQVNVILVYPEKYMRLVLGPKIQQVAGGKFEISVYRPGSDQPVYTSSTRGEVVRSTLRKPFWLLSGYEMGIELKDRTIADLARDRMRRSLWFVGLMDALLLFGAALIYRNIRQQVELTQLKSDFISNVSHEIRTPLALISMYVETLEMERVKDKNKIKEYYTVILNETARLSAMVNRILSFSQIEGKKRKFAMGHTDLNEVAEATLRTFTYTLENKGFRFSLEPTDLLPLVQADREAVADALVNLIDNAMKYSGEQKEITVRSGLTGNFAWLEVEDRGIGISEKDQRHIFDKFYRVTEKNLANRVKGSGLGLSIVKHIMEAHAGKITVKSSPGAGSAFRLHFPVNSKKK
jgi:two-component system, OmpR family, phosphate regulon sensor histidine kinase PhoR